MLINIIIGSVLAVILLFDFVYLPLRHEGNEQDRSTAQTQKPADSPGALQGAGTIGGPDLTVQKAPPSTEAGRRQTEASGTAAGDTAAPPAPAAARPPGSGPPSAASSVADRDARPSASGEAGGTQAETAGARKPAAGPAEEAMAAWDADERTDALKKQLGSEQARSVDLDRDLAAARDRLALSDRDRMAAEAARRDAEAKRADTEAKRADAEAEHAGTAAKLDQERRLATDLADRLSAAQRDGAVRLEAVVRTVDAERARSAALERDLVAARIQLSQADRDVTGRIDAGPLPIPEPAPAQDGAASPNRTASGEDGVASESALPERVVARIILRYSRGNAAARTHAAAFKSTLQSRGLDVGDLISTPQDTLSSGIAYYYDEDRDSADRIATLIGSSGPVKVKIPRREKIRPGRVDVMVAG